MIYFFKSQAIIAVKTKKEFSNEEIKTLEWLFSDAVLLKESEIKGSFIGPRKEMVTPWSTTATEITQNMNIEGIERIEEFFEMKGEGEYDKMLQRVYDGLGQDIFTINKTPEPLQYIENIAKYNESEGLALSSEEIEYLDNLSVKIGRKLTDGEVFGFSQINSEHCRHKIFNGTFIIDGEEKESSLFKLIKKTSSENPGRIFSAYKDNCAFIEGHEVDMFYPNSGTKPDYFKTKKERTVISLKAETHNFPTTVEPFNGAATGSGGEIRDRIAGGKGSFPIAGTAVYMTSYPRFSKEVQNEGEERVWENTQERKWLYQTPEEILIKASNGASDFGNKFGQPIICGSLLTMEHTENDPDGTNRKYGYDKVIMLAGGVGYAKRKDGLKEVPEVGDKVVVLGGDNYRIGMGGGAVSSVATGEYDSSIELNAIQRSNPEMQKRAYNAIRALAEKDDNPIISVHDHGAGGHLNCLSELVEEKGGDIDIEKLPVGDPTLSAKEIVGNESQERMGLIIRDTAELEEISKRERAPFYEVGRTTGKNNFTLKNNITGEATIDLQLSDLFGSAPITIMNDESPNGGFDGKGGFKPIGVDFSKTSSLDIEKYIKALLQIEAVACKDWLTNKVDRSVTGLIACQQTCGEIQLPINNLGVTAIGYNDKVGIATSIGHAPVIGLINPASGSRMAIGEALTNIVWAKIEDGISGISLSANWMWPCKNQGENARLYEAVEAASDFAIELGLNIPTGKDSMSMTQKYPDGDKVLSPGTLIISSVAAVSDINMTIRPNLLVEEGTSIFYLPFVKEPDFSLGGSSFAQTMNIIGAVSPDINDAIYFKKCFESLQLAMFSDKENLVLAGHDISSGGLITSLLEMNFPNKEGGMNIDLSGFPTEILFSETPGVLLQIRDENIDNFISKLGEDISIFNIGRITLDRKFEVKLENNDLSLEIDSLRDLWFKTSYLLDRKQVGEELAKERYDNYKKQPLLYDFPKNFAGKNESMERKYNAAIIREKGSNGDREMAWCLYNAGFNVKDVHVTDLVEGREDLTDVSMIVFVGGFSNADTLGSAKGWAGALLYNEKASKAINDFYDRKDTLSLGVCNGCQLMAELGLITPDDRESSPKMTHNDSNKFESGFVGVSIENSPSVLLSSLEGSNLGIWLAHGEGKFVFPKPVSSYNIAVRYHYHDYPANPNGSPEGIAAVCSSDGRHLAIMPHPERCLRPWNWANYPVERRNDEVTPWAELFTNARKWVETINEE